MEGCELEKEAVLLGTRTQDAAYKPGHLVVCISLLLFMSF